MAGAKHGAIGCLSADEELQQSVCNALIAEQELDSSKLEVRAASGTVVLSGSVRCHKDWLRAFHIACRQPGALAVRTDDLAIEDDLPIER